MIYISRLLKIKNKILIIGLILSLGPTIILGSALYMSTKKHMEETSVAALKAYAEAKTREINEYVGRLSEVGYFVSTQDRLVQALDSLAYANYNLESWNWLSQGKPKIEALGQEVIQGTGFHTFMLATPSGNLAYSTNPDDMPGTDLSGLDYVTTALEGRQAFSRVFHCEATGSNCIAIVIPVTKPENPEHVLGAAGFAFAGDHLAEILHTGSGQLGSGGNAYLIDEYANLLTNVLATAERPALNQKIQGLPGNSVLEAISANRTDFSQSETYKGHSGKDVIGNASVIQIGNRAYGLIIEADKNEVFACLAGLRRSIFLVTAIVIVAVLLISNGYTQSLLAPINNAVAMVKKLAEGEGDLSQRLEIDAKGEMEQLATWFNKFLDYISEIVKSITVTSDHLAATSQELSATSEESTSIAEQIAETAHQLASGAAEQSVTAADTAAAAEKLSMAVEKVAVGTQAQHGAVDTIAVVLSETNKVFAEVMQALENVRTVASDNTTAAGRATESIQVLSSSMSNIQQANESAATQVFELHDLSQSIRQIISVIDDIASQTNLLALNAAIEAARAGEHGRGFAVVADEVRKLAERSLAETKSISELINKVASSIEHTVTSIEQSTQEIQEGSAVAEDANQVLAEIGAAATGTQQEVGKLLSSFEKLKQASAQTESAVNDIAVYAGENLSGVEEMAVSAEEVKRLIENVAAVSQESAAAIEQVAASIREMAAATDQVSSSAQDLAGQAETLQSIVGNFRI